MLESGTAWEAGKHAWAYAEECRPRAPPVASGLGKRVIVSVSDDANNAKRLRDGS